MAGTISTGSSAGVTVDAATWWQRTLPWWHVAFVANLVVVSVVLLAGDADLVTLTAIALLGLGYAVLGRPALREDRTLYAVGYLTLATVLLGATVFREPAAMLLLITLYPQCFAMLDRFSRAAVAATTLTIAATTALAAQDGWSSSAVRAAGLTGLVNLTVAVTLALFIASIIRESDRRAGLLAALSAAQQQLAEAHHEAGVVAERERLAREIHDTLAQGFTSIVVLARAIEARLADLETDGRPGQVARADVSAKVRLLEETAQANLAEARGLVAALPPQGLGESGLVQALQRAADRCAREADLTAALSVEGQPHSLSGARDVVLLRVTQEALANVVKHARAAEVQIALRYDAAGTVLVVTDDGVGFEPGTRTGYGLAGMRQRVEEVGGDFCVETTPGTGTRLQVTVP